MSSVTTPGKLLFNQGLPPEFQDESKVYDGKAMEQLLADVGRKYPEKFPDVLMHVSKVSGDVVTEYGRTASFSIKDFKLPPELKTLRDSIKADVFEITQDSKLSSEQKNKKIIDYLSPKIDEVQAMFKKQPMGSNSLIDQVKTGARGNAIQIMQLLFGDMLVLDHKDRPVPVPGLHGYAEGVTPVEYWGSSYGSRKGFSQVQSATSESGFLGKKLTQVAHRMVVTEEDCGAKDVGLPVDGSDTDNIGSILSRPAAGLDAGHVIEKEDLPKLEDKTVHVRSVVTCQAREGVCSKCAGRRENGEFPEIGYPLGITASRAIAEPITQLGLRSKHCLFSDTLVRMADWSVKMIKDIKIGDMVLGSNISGHTFPARVMDVFNNGARRVYRTIYRKGSSRLATISLESTLEHNVLQMTHKSSRKGELYDGQVRMLPAGEPGNWILSVNYDSIIKFKNNIPLFGIKAKKLKEWPIVPTNGSNSHYRCRRISQEFMGDLPTWDIQVDHPDHLFVLANGMIVSNSGGVVGHDDISGFKEIDQMLEVPKHFRGGSAVATLDGSVGKIEKAPQGGEYVYIGDVPHYIPTGHDAVVRPGDKVEAGDVLSTGMPNPAEIVKYKGIGEGRRYFTSKFHEILKDEGIGNHRRNVEAMARAFINRVEISSPDGHDGYLVGDIVPYDDIVRDYEPRDDSKLKSPLMAVGHYLEHPVLHHTIGTRITPALAKKLSSEKISAILVHKDPPPFEPLLERSMEVAATDPDWMVQLGGFNLKKNLLESAARGSTSTVGGTSYIPSLVSGGDIYKNILKDKK